MGRVLLDTKFWIYLKETPDKFEKFYNHVDKNDDIEVIFAFPNFMDLINRGEQDAIAKVVAHTADLYLPPLPYDGDTYPITEDPLGLVPDQPFQQDLRKETIGFDEEEKLKTLFRVSDLNPPEYDWGEELHQYRTIVEEYSVEHLMAVVFDDYLERDDDGIYHLDQSDIGIIEFVRKMPLIYRIAVLDPNEKPDPNDMNDLALCTSAIVCECSVFAIEEKWVNVDVIGDVIRNLANDQEMKIVTEYDNLLPAVKNHNFSKDDHG